MKNQVQLITYVDRLGGRRDGADLARLKRLLTDPASPLAGVFGGVHLLPFFHAIDGADAGFDPIDHTQVEPRLGGWADVKTLTDDLDVMADVIVNHMSAESPQFLDYAVRLTDGRVVTGLISGETDAGLTLRRAEKQEEAILRTDISEITTSGKSLMPDGMEQKIKLDEMADLTAYLKKAS